MPAPVSDDTFELLKRLEPVSCLSPDQIREVLRNSHIGMVGAGTTLFEAGDRDYQCLYLLSGDVELQPAGAAAAQRISGGSDEARHPLADNYPRRVTACTLTPSRIVRIDKELLDTLVTWSQITVLEEAVVMSEDGIITINKADWLKTMLKSPTFRSLPPANIEELLHRLEPVLVHAGDVIIRQGDPGDYFYLIDDGTSLVARNPDNDEDSIEIAELNKGDTFGEAALISDSPRNATVSMMTDGVLLRLSKGDFIKLLTEPTLQWTSLDQAMRDVDAGAQWIDVRLPAEHARSHLPGAISIPIAALHKTARTLDRSRQYICYCQTGRRSSAAAFTLRSHGINACVLSHGLQNVPKELLADS
jgi:CRP-like cAMP-binding protein